MENSSIKFSCPNCGQHLSAEEALFDTQIECPACAETIMVPSALTGTIDSESSKQDVADILISSDTDKLNVFNIHTLKQALGGTWRKAIVNLLFILIVSVFVIGKLSRCDSGSGNGLLLGSSVTSEDIYDASTQEKAIKLAEEFMHGTWTYTGQELSLSGGTLWLKWVIKPDGTMESYSALATEDNWGEADADKWSIVTKKWLSVRFA